jgi:hypothetical protein
MSKYVVPETDNDEELAAVVAFLTKYETDNARAGGNPDPCIRVRTTRLSGGRGTAVTLDIEEQPRAPLSQFAH